MSTSIICPEIGRQTTAAQPGSLPRTTRIALQAALFVLATVSRLPFASKTLYTWDSVGFALALKQFDIGLSQPQAPGYILYVGIARVLQWFTNDPNVALVSLSILAGAAGTVAMYRLALLLMGDQGAILAALLWATSPLVWFQSEVAETYAVGGAAAIFSALAAASLWKKPGARRALIAGGVFAFSAGVRQDQAIFMSLVALFPFVRRKECRRYFVPFAAVYALGYATWYLPQAWSVGGPREYARLARGAFLSASHTSVLMGAPAAMHLLLLAKVAVGMTLGMGFALFLIPSVAKNCRMLLRSDVFAFLLCWATPSMLFYVLFHFGRWGYALTCLAALLLMAEAGLVPSQLHWRTVTTLGAAICVINATLFLAIPSPTGVHIPFTSLNLPPNYSWPVRHDIWARDAIKDAYFPQIRTLMRGGASAIVFGQRDFGDMLMSWRTVMYYFEAVPTFGIHDAGGEPYILAAQGRLSLGQWASVSREGVALHSLAAIRPGSIVVVVGSNDEVSGDATCREETALVTAQLRYYRLYSCELNLGTTMHVRVGSAVADIRR